jgi:2-phosphoglycerate kinase
MIYVLTGVAKSGKSYVARYLLEHYNLSHFGTDYLMMGLSIGNPALGIDHNADDAIVANQLKPYLTAMIDAMVRNKIDYLIEGVHFNPDFAEELMTTYPGKIRVLYLGYPQVSVEDKVEELLKYRDKLENCWYKHFTRPQMIQLVEYMIRVSKTLQHETKKRNIPFIEIENIVIQTPDIAMQLME